MKRCLLLILAIVLVSSLILVGCNAPAPSPAPVVKPTPAPAPTPAVGAYKWPATLEFLAPNVSESRYQELASIAPLLEQSTGTKVRIISEDATANKMKWIISKRYLFNAEGVSGLASAIQADTKEFATEDCGPFPLRVIWDLQDGSLGIATQADSKIKTLADVKAGLKIGIPPLATIRRHINAFLAWNNLKESDIVVVPFSDWPSSAKALIDGKVDIAYVSVISPYMTELQAGPHGVRMLEMDPAKDPQGAARFLAVSPTLSFGKCSTGIKEAQGIVMNLVPTPLYTRAETDTELVYNMTKWFVENYNTYKDKYTVNYQMSKENMRTFLDRTFLPIHDGTIKYLKEIGMWTPKDDEANKANAELVDKFVKAYVVAMADAKKQGISIDAANQAWLDLWAKYRKDIPILKTRL